MNKRKPVKRVRNKTNRLKAAKKARVKRKKLKSPHGQRFK